MSVTALPDRGSFKADELFRSRPTVANAFLAWLIHCKMDLLSDEFKSACNFARAFQIWFNKTQQPHNCQTALLPDDFSISRWSLMFVEDIDLCDNPIMERLHPQSKTSYVGKNCRSIVDFIISMKILSEADAASSIQECAVLAEDLPRCKRALWVLYQHEIFFQPKLGGRTHPATLAKDKMDSHFTVSIIKENFILVDVPTDVANKSKSAPVYPIAIQVPPVVAGLLKINDDIFASIRKVKDADYWIITTAHQIEPRPRSRTWGALTNAELDSKRDNVEYQQRSEALLEISVPDDGFPNEVYTEDWFTSREHDFTSDDKITGVWDDDMGDDN